MFLSSIFKKEFFKKRIFTYYIPAPPLRKSGYQEKEFDGLLQYIQNLGFEIIDFKLQSHSNSEKSGLWVICILGAPSERIWKQKIDYDHSTQSSGPSEDIPLDPDIIHD